MPKPEKRKSPRRQPLRQPTELLNIPRRWLLTLRAVYEMSQRNQDQHWSVLFEKVFHGRTGVLVTELPDKEERRAFLNSPAMAYRLAAMLERQGQQLGRKRAQYKITLKLSHWEYYALSRLAQTPNGKREAVSQVLRRFAVKAGLQNCLQTLYGDVISGQSLGSLSQVIRNNDYSDFWREMEDGTIPRGDGDAQPGD